MTIEPMGRPFTISATVNGVTLSTKGMTDRPDMAIQRLRELVQAVLDADPPILPPKS